MPFELVAYDRLKKSVLDSIDAVIHKYSPLEEIDPKNREAYVHLIPNPDRRRQVRLLLKTIELLDKESDESLKARVLNSVAYDVTDQIKIWCKETRRDPNNSTLYTSLVSSLELSKSNFPGDHCLYYMYNCMASFLSKYVYHNSDFYLGYRPEQPFKIQDYNIREDLDRLSERVVLLAKNGRKELEDREQIYTNSIPVQAYGNLWVPPKAGESRALFNLVPFADLAAKIEKSIKELESTERGITEERKPQVDFLRKIIELLKDEPDEFVKDKILNAAVYLIIAKIEFGYKWLDPTKWSNFYPKLREALNLTTTPKNRSLLHLYSALADFLNKHVYVQSDPYSGYLPEQPLKIAGYSARQDIDDLYDTLLTLEKDGRIKAEEMEELRSPTKAVSPCYGSLWWSSGPSSSVDNNIHPSKFSSLQG